MLEEDDDYWHTSDTKARALSFDDDVLSPQEILAIGGKTSSSSQEDSFLSSQSVKTPLLPLSSVVSPKVLQLLLLAQSGKDPTNKQTDKQETVATTLKRLVLGRSCSLHSHRSLKSKTELLDGAIAIGDGNAILTVVLFLIQTLNKMKVYALLSPRPLAANHYISFLLNEGKTTELTDLLTMLGRLPDAAIYQFYQTVKYQGSNIDGLLKKLKNISSNHFDLNRVDAHLNKTVSNYIKLLEWQKCTSITELYNQSVVECLTYCCTNHWNEGAGKMMSPLTLCQQQQISPLQYDWVALNVHANLKNWEIVETLFTRKDWFGRSTMSSSIPLPAMILKLHELKASKAVLANFINKITNSEQRLEIAKQFKVHSIVIESLAKNRDRLGLNNYKVTLNPQSEEYFLAENTLRDSNIKWRN